MGLATPGRHVRRIGPLLLALVALAPGRAQAGETVEPWEDGTTPHRRFGVDDAGLKDGRFVEYFRDGKTAAVEATYRHDVLDGPYAEAYESGKLKLRTAYRAGKLSGKYEAFTVEGDPAEVATYKDGAFEGKRQVWRAKRLVATQVWKTGTLASLDGIPAFPRPREEVRQTLARILSGELPAAAAGPKPRTAPGAKPHAGKPTAGDASPALAAAPPDLDKYRTEALRRLRAYRYLCEVPWEDVVAGEAQTLAAQYASLVCAKLGRITHEPPNPGLPEDVFRKCAAGAASCNLHLGVGMTGVSAVDGWMDDSDPTNVQRVGHRRWALSLRLRDTGFGFSDGEKERFTAMATMDESRVQAPATPYVLYPPRGFVPSELFSDHHAWSVCVDRVAALKLDLAAAVVRVRRLSADFVPAEEPLALDVQAYATEDLGDRPALIFRPKGVETTEGAAYLAEISVVDAKTHKPTTVLRWITEFIAPTPAPDKDPAGDAGGDPK